MVTALVQLLLRRHSALQLRFGFFEPANEESDIAFSNTPAHVERAEGVGERINCSLCTKLSRAAARCHVGRNLEELNWLLLGSLDNATKATTHRIGWWTELNICEMDGRAEGGTGGRTYC